MRFSGCARGCRKDHFVTHKPLKHERKLDMERTNVGIVGMGTVGAGVARLLLDQGDRTARHAGRTLWLKRVVVNNVDKRRDVELPEDLLTNDLTTILNDPEITVVAQLIGGLEPARSIMLQLLESGKDIVTANKALLAEHGPELFDRARELGRSIAFEASVAGGIPIITAISQCLSANQITSLRGILNGTSNFIVSQMEDCGTAYAAALAEAQRRGFAEADPAMDVDGTDAAQKLAILAHLAFGARVHWSEIPRVGIDTLDPADLRYAKELGYRIKLLAIAQLDGLLELHVSPTLVRIGQPLAEVREAYNAVRRRKGTGVIVFISPFLWDVWLTTNPIDRRSSRSTFHHHRDAAVVHIPARVPVPSSSMFH